MAMFRDLRADEIECRVAQATQNGVSLLLYKDARCDQNILDETVGPMNWMRSHCRDNANCIVSLWDREKRQWISKEDTGTESNTEKEKGLASDSFKRACFNWGIGRELYTAPFIWVDAKDCQKLEKDDKSGRWKCNDKFEVGDIAIENKKIIGLTIRNGKNHEVVFRLERAPILCSDCGVVIPNAKDENGKTISARRIIAASKERFGDPLCYDCMCKRAEA